MPGSRHKILSHVFSGFSAKMGRTKVLDVGAQAIETPLKRCLTTFDITLLGNIRVCYVIYSRRIEFNKNLLGEEKERRKKAFPLRELRSDIWTNYL